ncbi:MAG: hypothetical protein HQ564_05335 [Candidatus Saganbacteria bacterium]|nr:hypothetical protein [Candidatus Saganbacteria bacterium]
MSSGRVPPTRSSALGVWWKTTTTRRKFLSMVGIAGVASGTVLVADQLGILPGTVPTTPAGASTALVLGTPLTGSASHLDESKSLLTNFSLNLEKALGKKFFLVETVRNGQKVSFIQSLTQGNQIVSEGMGYAMSILTNYSKRLYAESINPKTRLKKEFIEKETKKAQEQYNALMRGVLLTLNKNGLPGWRCYFNKAKNDVDFASDYEYYSAADADIYIAAASMDAEALVQAGFWKDEEFDVRVPPRDVSSDEGWAKKKVIPDTGRFNYSSFTRFMARGIMSFDVEEKGKRLILRVSDMWGGGDPGYKNGDIKGCVTANDSYSLLNEFYRLAMRFPEKGKTRNFLLQIRKDAFDRIKASYDFGKKLFGRLVDIETVVNAKNPVSVRLESDDRRLLLSLLYKITPPRTKFKKMLPDWKKHLGYEKGHLVLKKDSYQTYLDGSWEIDRETYLFVMKMIRKYGVQHFFPDQVEVEVAADKRTYNVRFERDALNLDFTEGFDGIRVYAELGKDLLMHNDTDKDSTVPLKYRISGDEKVLLAKVMSSKYRDPEHVRAGRYRNPAAVSSYLMAAAGLAAYERAYLPRFNGFRKKIDSLLSEAKRYNPKRKGMELFNRPQNGSIADYYNAMLSLKNMSEFLARDSNDGLPDVSDKVELKAIKRTAPEEKVPTPLRGHEDIDYLVNGFKNDLKTASWIIPDEIKAAIPLSLGKVDPLSKAAAFRRLRQAIRSQKANPNDPSTRMRLVRAYMGAGFYHEALTEVFGTLRDMPDATKEIGVSNIKQAVSTMIDIMRIFGWQPARVSDVLEWMIEREPKKTNKRRFLELALVHEYNEQRRVGMAEALIKGLESIKKVSGESARHIINLGNNGRNPLPREAFEADLLAEQVLLTSRTYSTTMDAPPLLSGYTSSQGYPTRVYPYQAAIDRAKKYIKEGKVSSDLSPRLTLSMGRIMMQAAYDRNDSIKNRKIYSKTKTKSLTWRGYWGKKPGDEMQEYSRVVSNVDRAIDFYTEALKRENKGIQDPDFLSMAFDGIIQAYAFKITILRKRISLSDKVYNDSSIELGNNLEDQKEILQTIRKIDEIRGAIDRRFGSPWGTRVSSLGGDPIDNALINIVNSEPMRSPDPRNINYINWIRKLTGLYTNVAIGIGTGLVEKSEIPSGQFDKVKHLFVPIDPKAKNLQYSDILEFKPDVAGDIKGTVAKSGIPLDQFKKVCHLFVNPKAKHLTFKPYTTKVNIDKCSTTKAVKVLLHQALDLSQVPQSVKDILRRGRPERFFGTAMALSAMTAKIELSNNKLKAQFVIEQALKMTEAIYNYQEIIRGSDLSIGMSGLRKGMLAILQGILSEKSASLSAGADENIKKMVNYLTLDMKTGIKEVFADDATQEAKVRVSYANFLWWGESDNSKNKEAAKTQYSKALSANPFNLDALLGLANINFSNNKLEEGMKLFVRALRIGQSGGDLTANIRIRNILKTASTKVAGPQEGTQTELRKMLIKSIIDANNYLATKNGEMKQEHLDRLNEIFRAF